MTNDEMKRRILRPALSIRRVDSSVAISWNREWSVKRENYRDKRVDAQDPPVHVIPVQSAASGMGIRLRFCFIDRGLRWRGGETRCEDGVFDRY
jgi:hypothetical protein